MKCRCRTCSKVYDHSASRADWQGFCSQACVHAKAKALGYTKAKAKALGLTEYDVLKRNNCIGSVPT